MLPRKIQRLDYLIIEKIYRLHNLDGDLEGNADARSDLRLDDGEHKDEPKQEEKQPRCWTRSADVELDFLVQVLREGFLPLNGNGRVWRTALRRLVYKGCTKREQACVSTQAMPVSNDLSLMAGPAPLENLEDKKYFPTKRTRGILARA